MNSFESNFRNIIREGWFVTSNGYCNNFINMQTYTEWQGILTNEQVFQEREEMPFAKIHIKGVDVERMRLDVWKTGRYAKKAKRDKGNC